MINDFKKRQLSNICQILKQAFLFLNMSDSEITGILENDKITLKCFSSGDVIYSPHDFTKNRIIYQNVHRKIQKTQGQALRFLSICSLSSFLKSLYAGYIAISA